MKVTSLRYLDATFHHPNPKIKKNPKNTNGRLAIPALAGLLVYFPKAFWASVSGGFRIHLLLVTSVSDLPMHTIIFCSVVFGATLKLFVINTMSPVSREQQTTPLILYQR